MNTRLVFVEIPCWDGLAVCDYINTKGWADYVMHVIPVAQIGMTQLILRVPINVEIS